MFLNCDDLCCLFSHLCPFFIVYKIGRAHFFFALKEHSMCLMVIGWIHSFVKQNKEHQQKKTQIMKKKRIFHTANEISCLITKLALKICQKCKDSNEIKWFDVLRGRH